MSKNRPLVAILTFISYAAGTITILSCTDLTSTIIKPGTARIQVDTVRSDQLPTRFDTLTLYIAVEPTWGFLQNPARADSLANRFAQSDLKIADMWFPIDEPICLQTFITYNEISIRLWKPDTLVNSLGYSPASGISACFRLYKHYRFIPARTSG